MQVRVLPGVVHTLTRRFPRVYSLDSNKRCVRAVYHFEFRHESRQRTPDAVERIAVKRQCQSLLRAARAQKYGLMLGIQVLSCPGASRFARRGWRRTFPDSPRSNRTPGNRYGLHVPTKSSSAR